MLPTTMTAMSDHMADCALWLVGRISAGSHSDRLAIRRLQAV